MSQVNFDEAVGCLFFLRDLGVSAVKENFEDGDLPSLKLWQAGEDEDEDEHD